MKVWTHLLLAAASVVGGFADAAECQPWSHLNFQDDPGDFRFAIGPDRGGGDYRGAFTNALRCADLMHPAFVMTVGNHDVNVNLPPQSPKNYEISSAVWREHFGDRRYYHFVYKNCLFLVLDTMDGRKDLTVRNGISSEQHAWIRQTLAANEEVRWTCLFMHHPAEWETEAWNRLETEVLVPRGKYTVFAGDVHSYFHVHRHGFDYYILSVAGGVGCMAYAHKQKGEKTPPTPCGPDYGEMDHIMWVTMTANGPEVVNLKLDGILPGDYLNRATSKDDTQLYDLDVPPDPAALKRCRELKWR